ncbi:MAG: C1 family peptidase [Devosia sp.]
MPMLRVSTFAAAAMALLLIVAGASAASAQQKHPTGALVVPDSRAATIPQAPVFRDYLPQAIDLTKYFPPVGDQKMQGSCVGWSTAYAARAYYAEMIEHRDTTLPQNQPSPAYIFDTVHVGDDCGGGAYVPDAMEVLLTGSYSMAEFPYDDSKCDRPGIPQRAKATDFKIGSYEQVWDAHKPDLDKVKGALAKGHPVVLMALVDDAFQALSPKNRIWRSTSATAGDGHAFTLVGYDDRTQTFKFINSWGTNWGLNGYGWMTYDTFGQKIYAGYIMHLQGDPDNVIAETDLNFDPVDTSPPPPLFVPPINVRPTGTRSLDAGPAPVDLGELSCGKVDIATDDKGNRVAVGFVGTQDELDRVNEALKDQVEDSQVTLAPWPACEVRQTLAASLADSDAPQAVIDPTSPKVGDGVRIGIRSPGFASYLYAAYLSADGTVSTLAQPDASALKAKAAHTIVTFGDASAGEMQLQVSPPVGDEMLVVLASERPLFDAVLADSQTDRQFLSSLREALLTGDAGRVTATVLPVTTTE